MKGEALGQAVDQQPWDPSVKALTAFPSVLGNMDKNLSWTSSLGDAYYNQQQDVMDAVQVMRQKAQAAGALKNPQQKSSRRTARISSLSLPSPMWFMSRRIIRGWFTDIPSWRGRDGIRIPESGLAARISHSDSASESVGSAVLDGAGVIGDSTGITDTQCLAAAGTTRGAERFITEAVSTAAEAYAAELMVRAAELMAHAADSGRQPPGLSTETGRRLEDTLNPAVRAAHARAPSAAMSMADRPRAIRHAEAPAWVAEQRVAAAEREVAVVAEREAAAGVIDRRSLIEHRSFVMFFVMFRIV